MDAKYAENAVPIEIQAQILEISELVLLLNAGVDIFFYQFFHGLIVLSSG